MKRYLMRGGVSPLDNFSPDQIYEKNLIGANCGNLLYAFGVYRTLKTDDVTIDMDYYGVEREFKDQDIDRINETYDAYICPLADAFRNEFAGKLIKYANFIKRLKIPFYVIGMGLREEQLLEDGTRSFDYKFNEEAQAFLKAVLSKSAMIGLRGEMTGEYLKFLGFKEEEDYSVIGCPSMYIVGRQLRMREVPELKDGAFPSNLRLSLNLSTKTPQSMLKFLNAQRKRFKDYYCIFQNTNDLALIYYGAEYKTRFDVKNNLYPLNVSNPIIKEDRGRMFINIPTWLRFMQNRDLSVGSKLHGNIAGILGGCPSILFPIDGRMNELIRYHKFPFVSAAELENCRTLEDVVAKADLTSYINAQGANFDHFIDFIEKNGLDHVYKQDRGLTVAPIDRQMAEIDYQEAGSILKCDRAEAIRRFNAMFATAKKAKGKKSKVAEVNQAETKIRWKDIRWEDITFGEMLSYFGMWMRKRINR